MPNDLTAIIPKVLARALIPLRERVVMPRLVNSDFSRDAAKKGATIDVPVPGEKTATDVTPSNTPPTPGDTVTSTVKIVLDQWKHSDFFLTDDDMQKIDANANFVPMEMQSSIDAIANAVNDHIFSQYKGIYGFTGAVGTTLFETKPDDATILRKVLSQQKAPTSNRRGVVDLSVEAAMTALPAFADASASTDRNVVIEGEIGRKYGFDWFADDKVPTHTAGSVTGAVTVTGANAIGATSIGITTPAGGATAIVVGDIITFAGDAQTYVATAALTLAASASGNLLISPALKSATVGGEAVSVKATHVVNLGFHRNAFAFASRPLVQSTFDSRLGGVMVSAVDPVTGLTLRLEVARQYKQTVWDLDILFGSKLVRPELAARLSV